MRNNTAPASLVLGSGGARGLAHIGVIQALEESGRFDIQAITGSSIGALIGGLYANDTLDTYRDWVRQLSITDVWRLLDFSLSGTGLFEGNRVMNKLADLVGEARIEDLRIPFTAVASDIEHRREVWIDRGSLFEAIRASIAIPGFFTPVRRDGRLLVDGGLLSPLPIAPAQRHSTEQLIVVSLNGGKRRAARVASAPKNGNEPSMIEDASLHPLQKLYHSARDKLGFNVSSDKPDISALDVIAKSLEAMEDRIARYQLAVCRPNLLIEIPADACGVLDFHCGEKMIELGYERAREALTRMPEQD